MVARWIASNAGSIPEMDQVLAADAGFDSPALSPLLPVGDEEIRLTGLVVIPV